MATELGIFKKTLINDEKERFVKEADNYIMSELYGIKK